MSNKINQPSDLFNFEIIPEITFQSRYGNLTLSKVIVPDFSSDEKGLIRLNEEFTNFKSFITEKDPKKKFEISEVIYENEFVKPIPGNRYGSPNRVLRSSEAFSDFIDIIYSSMEARLFELGLYSDVKICSTFSYEKRACLSKGNIIYNGLPVIQPLSCSGGLYIYILRCALNQKIFCVYPNYLNKVQNDLPKNNYLSWAFFNASLDEELLSFLSYAHPSLCFYEN